VGIVAFAGSAQGEQQATLARPSLMGAIDAIQLQMATAIALCLADLLPNHGIDLGEMSFGPQRQARSLDERQYAPHKQITPVAPGSCDSAAIILSTDGRRNIGVDTLQAAKMAADRGVRIHVVDLGTADGHLAEGEHMAIRLQRDEPTLREVVRMTGGNCHHAGTAETLRDAYQKLGARACSPRRARRN
jgi:Ca-activated chloride channel family protein